MAALARTGSKVLDDRARWDPLLERAAHVGYDPLRNNAASMQRALISLDTGSVAYTRDEAALAMGLVLNRCEEVGVNMDLPGS